jgi:heat shock protein HslJ
VETVTHHKKTKWLAAAALVAGLVPAWAASAHAAPIAEPTNCTTIDYTKASVAPVASAATAGTNRLTVTGTVPATNFTVTLRPLVYIQQPAFWGIEVVRCQTAPIGATIVRPFTATYDFTGALGRCGVEAIGATRHDSFDLAGCGAKLAGTSWTLTRGVTVPAGRTITASFSDTTISGIAACNLYSATYAITGPGRIDVHDDVITTRIACDEPAATAEAAYLGKLAGVTGFGVVGGRLTLTGTAGSLLFRSGTVATTH